ncbi:hypothetical protein B0T17DRAFT_491519 [Bombardia bombarda]|uniref:Potassium channel domain-containing protein n=1 Tax=Bombardia bombarda TaxID=252184 RepID=A0AA39X834_9PEZI|nr:hypothetical protein B0T17DRAFT_491519 [Bombardia bombarda]
MNVDSGENVDEHVRALDSGETKLPKRMENDEAHLDPSRWWFASSAFPMIAGTLGPVASAFSICALVRPWRQSYPPGTDVQRAAFVEDPVWLTAINAVQLIIAVAANFALLLNMTRRLRFSIAQPVTIVGWYISAMCLIALTSTAAKPLLIQPTDQYIWSQAFYYGVYSAILYFVVASLMVVTFMGAQRGHYPKDFMLTPSQRTLMAQTIMFLVYLQLGALVFSNIESWNYLDAVYWAAVTLFTVGFGDLYPETTLGRALLFPYALVGIISLGLVIGSIRSLVLDRGKRRLDARMIEKKRRRMVKRMTLKGKDDILVPIKGEPNEGLPPFSAATSTGTGTSSGLSEYERREKEFKLMRKIQHGAARRRRWYAMAISTGTTLVLWLVGAKVFQECEARYQQWSYFQSFYFAFVSLTTIGYGDVTPVSNAGKSFWVFWALLALPTMTVLISNAGDTIVKGIRDATDQIATITILPGDQGFRKDLKQVLRMLSFGRLFQEEIDESPPGIFGDARRAHDSDDDEDEDEDNDRETKQRGTTNQDQDEVDAEGQSPAATGSSGRLITFSDESSSPPLGSKSPKRSGSLHHKSSSSSKQHHSTSSLQLPKMSRAVSIPRQTLPAIPTNKAEYHLTLIEEIGRVTQHMKSHPPRKYTFQEWAYYLRLVGEDESDAGRHRKARPHLHGRKSSHNKQQEGKLGGDGDEEGPGAEDSPQWSWVGSRSPLMGSQEEAEWILEKLTERLVDELRGLVERGEEEE